MLQKKNCHGYVISIGSNSDSDRAIQNVKTAFEFLRQKFDPVTFSDIIPTPAVGMKVDCVFFNAVAGIKTWMKPAQLKSFLKETEKKMGRIPHSEEIIIDLDVILADGKIVHEDYKNREFIRELIKTISVN